jgi:hypothetical protein
LAWPAPSPIPSHGINCLAFPYTTQSTYSLWRWNWYMVPKRRQTTYWRRGYTQKNIYNIQITAKAWNLEYHIISYITYHIIYHILSCRVVSYHIIYHIIS